MDYKLKRNKAIKTTRDHEDQIEEVYDILADKPIVTPKQFKVFPKKHKSHHVSSESDSYESIDGEDIVCAVPARQVYIKYIEENAREIAKALYEELPPRCRELLGFDSPPKDQTRLEYLKTLYACETQLQVSPDVYTRRILENHLVFILYSLFIPQTLKHNGYSYFYCKPIHKEAPGFYALHIKPLPEGFR
jgi:hypothetical protein